MEIIELNHILRCTEIKERINRLNISIFLHSSIRTSNNPFILDYFNPLTFKRTIIPLHDREETVRLESCYIPYLSP